MGNTTKSPKYGKRIVGVTQDGRYYLTNYGKGNLPIEEGNRKIEKGELKLAAGVTKQMG